MTAQYATTSINVEQATPVVFSTQDATPTLITLYTLTEDGQSVYISLQGGGRDPAAPDVNNFVVDGFVTFTRDAGVVSAGLFAFLATLVGAGVIGGFTATGDLCQLSITGPAFPYDYSFLMTTTPF